MKRFSFFLMFALLVFSFGQAHGQMAVTLDSTIGLYNPTTVIANSTVRWYIGYQYVTGDGSTVTGPTNGFRVWTHSGGVYTQGFDSIAVDTLPINWAQWFDGGYFINLFHDPNPLSPIPDVTHDCDTVGFGGFRIMGPGQADPYGPATAWWIETKAWNDGDTLCLDSSFYQPGGQWLWSTDVGNRFPTWTGPHCFHVYDIPNRFPVFINCVPSLTFSHCSLATYNFCATDPDTNYPLAFTLLPTSVGGALTYTPGDTCALWTFQPNISHVGGSYSVDVEVCDALGACDTCNVNLNFTNVGPQITCPPDTVQVFSGETGTQQVTATDDCDPLTFYIAGVDPAPIGDTGIDATGLVTFNTDTNDSGLYLFTICVTDQIDTVCCSTFFEVIKGAPFAVKIEKTEKTPQGQHKMVKVTLERGWPMGGFDILIAFDRSALNFQGAYEGDLYGPPCNWEYFTYRWWFWPSYEPHFFWGGIVRVVGMAELNNGPVHPDCFGVPVLAVPFTLFEIDFLVTDNRLFECMYVPIRFFWTDCGDNTISDVDGEVLYVSLHVWEHAFDPLIPPLDIANDTVGFPTYQGVQDIPGDPLNDCFKGGKTDPIRAIDFINGGIDIICAESIDARGDINLNGIKNEVADAVVFTNYFIYGLGAFHISIEGQIAATDVNADGLTLTVGDLVYLIRVIIGDAMAIPKLAPVAANYTVDKSIVSVDAEMGAAYVVVEGDVTPILLADQMDMKYNYDVEENVTRVLVYSFAGNGFSGEFLNANGNVVSIELGSYEGAVVKATNIPADFALHQNYPNPFNPVTTISFNLPVATDYTLTIYNVTGQQVVEFTDAAEAGTVTIEWDASELASGVYFYKLNAENFSDTKKMVLLK